MKPRVFLSHSKKDQDFIKRLATDLRPARVDVWYDDWEIPPGTSLRVKIFEEGISGCDLFFVYLTQNSAESYWVQQELDAAFVLEVKNRGGFMSMFVDSDETRERLPLDLKSRRIPVINDESYSRCLLELAALSWEALLQKKVAETTEAGRVAALELEKKVLEQELEITNLRSRGLVDQSRILQELKETFFEIEGRRATLGELFQELSNVLASGAQESGIDSRIKKVLGALYFPQSDIIGPLVKLGLVKVHPPQGGWAGELFYLTDVGRDISLELQRQSEENKESS